MTPQPTEETSAAGHAAQDTLGPDATEHGQRETARLTPPAGALEGSIPRALRVPPESAGKRADVFLHEQLRSTSRSRARLIVERSLFRLDGTKVRPSERLRAEDRVVIWRPPLEERDEAAPLPVLYEDEHLLVVDKPPLVAVHPTARHHHRTVLKLLESRRPGQFFELIHRLDRETSGVLMLAKSPAADRAFKKLIEERTLALLRGAEAESIEKTYLALTWGTPPTGIIASPVEPDRANPLRVKMRIAAAGKGLPAQTVVEVLGVRGGYSLVRCGLLTGRQHQIRIHLASVGCPVVGDKLYGPDERLLARAADGALTAADLALLELPRHALHNHRAVLRHAMTGEQLVLVSPLEPDLQAFWDALPR